MLDPKNGEKQEQEKEPVTLPPGEIHEDPPMEDDDDESVD